VERIRDRAAGLDEATPPELPLSGRPGRTQ
jgi:hypothetical protein